MSMRLRSMVWQAVLLVAQLETQQKEWGVADKDTRALARQSQAKIKQAHQLVDQLALWEVLGTTQHPNQVRVTSSQLRSMVRGEPAPWEGESQTSQEGKALFFGRQFFHLLSDSQRCLEQLALLKVERARLNAWQLGCSSTFSSTSLTMRTCWQSCRSCCGHERSILRLGAWGCLQRFFLIA
ncbi:hypothetical protein V8C86DRAFT_2614897 [Haematococcus lacustris]